MNDIINNCHVSAVIVAAGQGMRAGGSVKKQFYEMDGKPLLAVTIKCFVMHPSIESIAVVLPKDGFEEYKKYISSFFSDDAKVMFIAGGGTRQESVYNGLKLLKKSRETDIVCIHDGVRPFVSEEMITDSIICAMEYGAAVAAVAVTDTVKRVKDGFVEETCDRSMLYAAQTPQSFKLDLILEAHRLAREKGLEFTDDSALAEAIGHNVHISPGSTRNIKVTMPEDFYLLNALKTLEE